MLKLSMFRRVSSCGHFTELQAAHVVYQVLSGVAYLHSHGEPCTQRLNL